MKDIGYGTGYQYAHDFQGGFSEMECLPQAIIGVKLFEPGQSQAEIKYRDTLKHIWKDKYGY